MYVLYIHLHNLVHTDVGYTQTFWSFFIFFIIYTTKILMGLHICMIKDSSNNCRMCARGCFFFFGIPTLWSMERKGFIDREDGAACFSHLIWFVLFLSLFFFLFFLFFVSLFFVSTVALHIRFFIKYKSFPPLWREGRRMYHVHMYVHVPYVQCQSILFDLTKRHLVKRKQMKWVEDEAALMVF